MFLYSITLFACLLTSSISWEYCEPEIQHKLCGGNKFNHTVCDPSNAFVKTVDMISNEFKGHVPITRKIKRIFLHIHNDYRNRVASGEEIKNGTNMKYPTASRMRELIWDNELMYVAHIHTLQTRMGHDNCRATQRFPFSGQNLGWEGAKNYVPIIEMLNGSLHKMYLEKDLVPNPVDMANKYSAEVKTAQAGHFAAIMNDRTSRVGCAISIGLNCKNSRVAGKVYPWCYYLGCNYDGTNIVNSYVYKTDSKNSATQCSDWGVGKSSQYEHLCANSGNILIQWKCRKCELILVLLVSCLINYCTRISISYRL